MKYIQLQGTSLNPSAIGFGCASIMGSVGKKRSLQSLDLAYSLGVNYFDVARSYGYGEAEKVLGKFIKGKRENVYIATKIGTAPSRKTQLLGKVKPLVRVALSRFPQARGIVSKQVMNLNLRNNFSPDSAKASLETSLSCLGTDYVDVLFLHGCTLEDCLNHELLDFLESCVKDGKVRYLGVATSMEETLKIIESLPKAIKVVQIKNNLFERNANQIPRQADIAIIAHSPFNGGLGLRSLQQLANENREELLSWSKELDILELDFRELIALTFQYAISSLENRGIILSSMFQEKHIRSNIELVNSSYSEQKILKFSELFESYLYALDETKH